MTIGRRTIIATSALTLGAFAVTEGHTSAEAKDGNILFYAPPTTIPVAGSDLHYQVRRIYCVGRNYAAHSREMGSDPTREPPFFFQKPSDAIQNVPIGTVADHPYPSLTNNYHYEVELVCALKSGGKNIPLEKALDHVYGYTVGLDMTRRDLQNAMKKEGKPWEIGKSFDHAAVLGPLHRVREVGHLPKGNISLAVNGVIKQQSDLDQMIWTVAEQISKLSEAFELMAGDIIYAGTPENVGPTVRGDVLLCKIDGLPDMSIKIV